MRLHVLSDLHTEFTPFDVPNVDAYAIVLAGDIGTHFSGMKLAQAQSKPVIYVAGNHEYYANSIPHHTQKLQEAAAGSNVAFLEDAATIIEGVRFLGCTLWTDFLLFGPDRWVEATDEAAERMRDYKKIHRSPEYRKLSPRNTALFHAHSVAWLRSKFAEPFPGPTVVVTHHAPGRASLKPHIALSNDVLAAAYASNLEPLIRKFAPALWIHGHTHHSADYSVGTTRVLSNPRGYEGEAIGVFNPELVVTL